MEKNNDSYSIVYEFFEAENNDSIASGAIDLRSNRNRPTAPYKSLVLVPVFRVFCCCCCC